MRAASALIALLLGGCLALDEAGLERVRSRLGTDAGAPPIEAAPAGSDEGDVRASPPTAASPPATAGELDGGTGAAGAPPTEPPPPEDSSTPEPSPAEPPTLEPPPPEPPADAGTDDAGQPPQDPPPPDPPPPDPPEDAGTGDAGPPPPSCGTTDLTATSNETVASAYSLGDVDAQPVVVHGLAVRADYPGATFGCGADTAVPDAAYDLVTSSGAELALWLAGSTADSTLVVYTSTPEGDLDALVDCARASAILRFSPLPGARYLVLVKSPGPHSLYVLPESCR